MSRAKGNIGEKTAFLYLKKSGFEIIESNFYAKNFGEIDIIAVKDEVYHFVEVKSGDSYDVVYKITPSKLSKIKKSIDYYLKVKEIDNLYQIDACIIENDNITFLENITL